MLTEEAIVPGLALVQALFRAHRRPCVATVGTFDGVHAGHRALLAAARQIADDRGLGVVPFSRAVAAVSAEAFAGLLAGELGMRTLCVGPDFALGRGRRGDVDALRALGHDVVTPPLVLAPDGRKVSSTDLRHAPAAAG
jgi:cytidyltransferase-like protein